MPEDIDVWFQDEARFAQQSRNDSKSTPNIKSNALSSTRSRDYWWRKMATFDTATEFENITLIKLPHIHQN